MKLATDKFTYVPYGVAVVAVSLHKWEQFVDKKLSQRKKQEIDFIGWYLSIPFWSATLAAALPEQEWEKIVRCDMDYMKNEEATKFGEVAIFFESFCDAVAAHRKK